MDDCRLREVRRHHRSISQLIASMDEFIAAEHPNCRHQLEELGSNNNNNNEATGGITNPGLCLNYDDYAATRLRQEFLYGQFDALAGGGGNGSGDGGMSGAPQLNGHSGDADSIGDANSCLAVEMQRRYRRRPSGDGAAADNYDEEETARAAVSEEEEHDTGGCLPDFQFSMIESEYDETLAFPDSVTIVTDVGEKPVFVRRDDDEDDLDDYDCASSSGKRSLASGCAACSAGTGSGDGSDGCGGAADGRASALGALTPASLPFTTLYAPGVKFNSFQRKVFVPGMEIQVHIVDTERSVTTHLLNPNLYTIKLSHGPYTWTIKRRYKHFNTLHQQLSFFRTSLHIPFPMRSHKEKRAKMKLAAAKQLAADEAHKKALQAYKAAANSSVASGGAPLANGGTVTQQQQDQEQQLAASLSNGSASTLQHKKKKKKKRKLPRFPNRPESLVTLESLPLRIRQLEEYLYNLLNISLYRSHHETLNFVEVSNLSFIAGLGMKGKEGAILKRTGSTRPGQAGCNFFGCFQQKCCVRCNYFCSDVVCGKWRQRWFFVKETCFGYIRPTDGVIRAVILFDQGFDVSTGIYQTGMRKGLQVLTNNRHIVLKCWTRRKSKEWLHYLKDTANTYARDFTFPNPHMSYVPVRSGVQASWHVDGAAYMGAVADGLEAACEEIYIADWWLSPEIYMKRPSIDGDYWRLDRILHRKASQGVRIFVLLYKEVEMAIGINSYYSKQRLVSLHENIKVIRHPDHARAGIFFWAHHEKLVIIDQTYAFLGGLDLCYGRWDDYRHRLTDLGSICIGGGGGAEGVRQTTYPAYAKDDGDSAFGSRKSSRNMQQKVEQTYSSDDEPVTTQRVQLRRDYSTEEAAAPTAADAELSQLEGMKLNTPEMERKNMLEKLTENAMKKGKDLVHRLTMQEAERVAATPSSDHKADVYTIDDDLDGAEMATIAAAQAQAHKNDLDETARTLDAQTYDDVYGQAKYWCGKDYANFILKDWMNLDAPLVDMIDRSTTPRMPWHDVGICVVGTAARDVARHFIQRWNAVKLEKMRDNVGFPYLLPKSYHHIQLIPGLTLKRQNRVSCQLLRSVSSWSCGFIEHDLVEQSIHDAYIQTITKAQHYIYIENQFFITMQLGVAGAYGNVRNQIGETLFKRIVRANRERKKFRVYVVVPLLPGFEGDVGGSTGNAVRAITHWNYASISRGRSAILTRLLEVGITRPSEYISFHSLRTHAHLNGAPITELIYVHSKLLIADDRVCICGSANINDRSMIGKRDSEIAAIITDEEFEDGRMNGKKYPSGIFAGRLRKFLFREHLGLLVPEAERAPIDVTDPVIDAFWHDKWRQISTNNTRLYDEVFKCIPTEAVRSFADLRKHQEEAPLCKTDPDVAAKRVANIQGYLVDLPLEFLNKEVLTPPGTSKEGLIPTSVWT